MGYQDRDYYRGEAPANPLAGSVVIQLIVVNVIVFLVNFLFGQSTDPNHDNWINGLLELQPNTLVHPLRWYQFLTYGFVHNHENLTHIGFNMLGLYFFGRAIEDRFGWKEFLRFYLVAILIGGIVWSLRNFYITGPIGEITVQGKVIQKWPHLLGASGGVTAVVILFCLYYPRATLLLFFFIPTPAWLAGLLIVLIDMFGAGPDRVAHDVHLTGAAFAAVYWYFGWHFGRMPGMAGIGRMVKAAGKSLQAKPDLRVHDPDPSYDDLDEEGDQLVEKVGREGMESLTPREREALEAYSRRMRQKHR